MHKLVRKGCTLLGLCALMVGCGFAGAEQRGQATEVVSSLATQRGKAAADTPTLTPTQTATPAPTATPTSTTIPTAPPSPMPTAAPAATPSPTVDLRSILKAFAPVAGGQGIPQAAAYHPDVSGPHRVVLLGAQGGPHGWNDYLPTEWSPSSVSEVALVVVVKDVEVRLDSASYNIGRDITRYRWDLDVEVREARTGIVLTNVTLPGSEPGPFPARAPVEQTRLDGKRVPYWSLQAWLFCEAGLGLGLCPALTLEHKGWVSSVAFSPDGKMLASGSHDETVRLWRVSDGSLLRTLEGHTAAVSNVAFSPDGQTLASGAQDHTVRLWRVSDGALLHTLEGHAHAVTSVAFSPDGQALASGAQDHTVRLWRTSDGALLRTLEGHASGVTSVAFAPDGQTLATGALDRTARLWRTSDGAILCSLEQDGGSFGGVSVAYSPDGQTLATGAFAYGQTLRLWRVSDEEMLRSARGDGYASLTYSPDGQSLAAVTGQHTIEFWRVSDLNLLRTLQGHTGWVSSAAYAPDGQTLATGSHDNTVCLWSIAGWATVPSVER